MPIDIFTDLIASQAFEASHDFALQSSDSRWYHNATSSPAFSRGMNPGLAPARFYVRVTQIYRQAYLVSSNILTLQDIFTSILPEV